MTTGGQQIDQIMEQASDALAGMAYLRCEKLCLEAMRLAREAKGFDTLGRIVLPLQEARRQRRQTAVEAGLHVLGPPRMDAREICRTDAPAYRDLGSEHFATCHLADELNLRPIRMG